MADKYQRPPGGPVGNERAAQLWAKARRRQQVAKAWASLRVTIGRLVERRGFALGTGKLLELVDIFDGVLVVGQDREPVRDVLETVLGDQV